MDLVLGCDVVLVLVAVHDALALDTLVAVVVANVVAEPLGLSAPIDVLGRLVCVGAATREAEGGAVHGLEGDVAGEQHQVGPRDLVAILLLDGPQQAAGLVERDVVGPGVERSKALLAFAAAAASVRDTVGASRVPCHADAVSLCQSLVTIPSQQNKALTKDHHSGRSRQATSPASRS